MNNSDLNIVHDESDVLNWFSRLGADDHEAFSNLLSFYQPVIFGQAVAYLRSVATAADVVQEVFLVLWKRRVLISQMENPPGYLMAIARNKIMDEFRNKVHENVLDTLETILVAPMPSIHLAIEEREMWQSVEAAIQRLPPQRKKVFELNKKQGLSYQEIADLLQISRETVKVHLVKAVAFLRHTLADRLVSWFLFFSFLENIFLNGVTLFV